MPWNLRMLYFSVPSKPAKRCCSLKEASDDHSFILFLPDSGNLIKIFHIQLHRSFSNSADPLPVANTLKTVLNTVISTIGTTSCLQIDRLASPGFQLSMSNLTRDVSASISKGTKHYSGIGVKMKLQEIVGVSLP